ncbi:MAG: V-type ATP synthase subunit F [Planctomycetota bacterium]
MNFYVIGDEDTVVGFRYAGVQGTVARDSDQAARELDRLVEEGEKMIVIITERTAGKIREKVDRVRFEETYPLVVEIPGPEGPSEEAPSLLSLIREAVGIKV